MDDISGGIATAALILSSVLLQALVNKGTPDPREALEVVGKSFHAVVNGPRA